MKKILNDLNIKKALSELVTKSKPESRKKLENRFLIAYFAPSLIFGAIVTFLLKDYNDAPNTTLLIYSLSLFTCSTMLVALIKLNISENTRCLLINFLISSVIVATYLTYFKYVGLAFWLVILLILIPSALTTHFLTTFTTIAVSIAILIHVFLTHQLNNSTLPLNHYYSFVIIYINCIAVILLIKNIYRLSIQHQQKLLTDIINQKEEITALYEEMVATEEELRQTNEQLTAYSVAAENNLKELEFYANNDPLTGLPNRKYIHEQLDKLCNSSQNKSVFAFAHVDLDDFKTVNDSLGHEIGDDLLISIANCLKTKLHPDDVLGRIGGDEFAIIINSKISKAEIQEYLRKIIDIINQNFRIKQYDISPTASIGVSIYPTDATKTTEIMSAADAAMYESKKQGYNSLVFYSEEMRQKIIDRIHREDALIKAIKNEDLFVVYQPIIDAETESVKALEALIRWQSETLGFVPPPVIIETAENLGIVSDITNYVLTKSCKALKHFIKLFGDDIYVSINLSPTEFSDKALADKIISILNKHGINTKHVVLEITESVFIHNTCEALNSLAKLRQLGVKIAIDDYGTGYSTLEYILKYPCDILKIDKTFIDVITPTASKRDIAFAESVVVLGHEIGMKVVAEGVEDSYQKNKVKTMHCDLIQGYYYSKPLPLKQILDVYSSANPKE